ncbi:hypothetical protein [Streptomyces sp. NPDC048411]|uniref:hypothetical protein n=1 Tax=Streptomyces sp. NPDC048411 TaxID=3157206 RepID=UPI0034521DF1
MPLAQGELVHAQHPGRAGLGIGQSTDQPQPRGSTGPDGQHLGQTGAGLEDWAFALRRIRPDSITTIKTTNGTFNSRTVPGVGSAEIPSPTSMQLLQAVRDDTVDAFVAAQPGWVADSGPAAPAQ